MEATLETELLSTKTFRRISSMCGGRAEKAEEGAAAGREEDGEEDDEEEEGGPAEEVEGDTATSALRATPDFPCFFRSDMTAGSD